MTDRQQIFSVAVTLFWVAVTGVTLKGVFTNQLVVAPCVKQEDDEEIKQWRSGE